MKIRSGFVSNSSSSSFICCISGGMESGYDACLDDVDMCGCEKDHTMYQSYMDKYVKEFGLEIEFEKYKNQEEDEDSEEYTGESYPYEVPSKFCPVCNFYEMDRNDLLPYILKSLGKTKEELFKEIKARFNGDYSKFQEWLKND
jgi:hypothetical protein